MSLALHMDTLDQGDNGPSVQGCHGGKLLEMLCPAQHSISEEQINQELIAGFKSQIAENEVQLEKAVVSSLAFACWYSSW